MKFLDPAAGLLVLALRLLWIPVRAVPADWIAVIALFWIARSLAREDSKARDWILAGTGLWLTGIYAWSQGPSTWTALAQF
ncbi:MAG TPA: hypothetical protein VKW04_11865 [Planctomycetota bacterium]|jgi:hypothetical protein|nr:hypothetical protein [Planctomycetota bacterium]